MFHKQQNSKVSVVIPVYNSAEWLCECIDSVLAQTLKDIEIICVNDGSTDECPIILAEYAAKDERICVINQDNMGLSCARNTGIDTATGKYIYFLDSDDMLVPEALDVLYTKMEELSLDLVSFNAKSFGDTAEFEKRAKWENETYFARDIGENVLGSGIELLAYITDQSRYVATAWCIMTLRSFVMDNDLRFIPGILHEDEAYVFEAYCRSHKSACVNKELYLRRCREDSIMMQGFSFKNVYGAYKSCKHIESVIKDVSIPEQYIDSIMSHLSRLERIVIDRYLHCSAEERGKIKSLPIAERAELEQLLIYPAKLESNLRKVKKDNLKLKKELSELKAKQIPPKKRSFVRRFLSKTRKVVKKAIS